MKIKVSTNTIEPYNVRSYLLSTTVLQDESIDTNPSRCNGVIGRWPAARSI